jgi:hypothetical protein
MESMKACLLAKLRTAKKMDTNLKEIKADREKLKMIRKK